MNGWMDNPMIFSVIFVTINLRIKLYFSRSKIENVAIFNCIFCRNAFYFAKWTKRGRIGFY